MAKVVNRRTGLALRQPAVPVRLRMATMDRHRPDVLFVTSAIFRRRLNPEAVIRPVRPVVGVAPLTYWRETAKSSRHRGDKALQEFPPEARH
jgi:hypothetical protein